MNKLTDNNIGFDWSISFPMVGFQWLCITSMKSKFTVRTDGGHVCCNLLSLCCCCSDWHKEQIHSCKQFTWTADNWVEIVRSSSLCWCCSDWMLRISKLTRTLMQDDHLLILTRAYITHDNIQLHITRKEAEDKKSCKRNCSVVHLIMCTNVNILLSVNYTLRLKIHLFNSFN